MAGAVAAGYRRWCARASHALGCVRSNDRNEPDLVDNLFLLLKSALAGFIVALPIGAIGAMCLRRALQGRWIIAITTGFGAAMADTLLATAAMLGLTLLTHYLLENQKPVLLVGGAFLIVIGVRMLLKRRPKIKAEVPSVDQELRRWRAWLGALATGFALTIINPATLLAFVGVFAGLGLFPETPNSLLQNWIIIAGVFGGSMLWWTVLTAMAFVVRVHLSMGWIVVLNVLLGLMVIGFGVVSLLSSFGIKLGL
ncbi:MAG: LysE family transporter [Rhodospirillales bacterium]|nr:LysE family transporter [Rhodospirillales bacterium]